MKRLFLILIILLVVGTLSTVFTIDETEQVVILQFGPVSYTHLTLPTNREV